MSKIKRTVIVSFLFGVSVSYSNAQESTTSSGGDATGSGGTVAYSIGQVAYTTNSGTSGSSAQGVQHAYEIFTVGVNETLFEVSIAVFPNPTSDYLTLEIGGYSAEKLAYQLYDMQGKVLASQQISSEQTQINMSNLKTASYFVYVIDEENKKLQSFKIIKQ